MTHLASGHSHLEGNGGGGDGGGGDGGVQGNGDSGGGETAVGAMAKKPELSCLRPNILYTKHKTQCPSHYPLTTPRVALITWQRVALFHIATWVGPLTLQDR